MTADLIAHQYSTIVHNSLVLLRECNGEGGGNRERRGIHRQCWYVVVYNRLELVNK